MGKYFKNRTFRKLFLMAVGGIVIGIPGIAHFKEAIIAAIEIAIEYGNMKGLDRE